MTLILRIPAGKTLGWIKLLPLQAAG